MRYFWAIVICSMVFCGCDQLKGKDGEKGIPSVAYSETFSGYADANPFEFYLSKGFDKNTDLIEVYIVIKSTQTAYDSWIKAPTTITYTHLYTIKDSFENYPVTNNRYQTKIALLSYNTNTNAKPTYAFMDTNGQNKYVVIHKQFNSPSACIAYKRSMGKLDTNPYDTLIYGREM